MGNYRHRKQRYAVSAEENRVVLALYIRCLAKAPRGGLRLSGSVNRTIAVFTNRRIIISIAMPVGVRLRCVSLFPSLGALGRYAPKGFESASHVHLSVLADPHHAIANSDPFWQCVDFCRRKCSSILCTLQNNNLRAQRLRRHYPHRIRASCDG